MNLPLLFTCLAATVAAADPVVGVREGNIILQPAEGAARTLTDTGRDAKPVLSPDGKRVVFSRKVPDKTISTGAGDESAEELWQVGTDGKDPVRLVAPRESEEARETIASFSDIGFSSDGRLVYFITPAWATSGAVHAVDTTNRTVRFVLPGNDLEVIRRGEYRDHLLVSQHRYFLGGGSFDWYWLFKPDGREVGPVGENPETFLEMQEE